MDRISQSSAGGLMSSMGKEVVSTPYFVVDERRLLHNLEILKQVAEESGCKILLAQKAFSMFSVYPLLRKYLCGTTASGLYEARLGKEEFGGETHVFSPAYRAEEFDELLQYVDDLVFNSPAQVRKYGIRAKNAGKSIGLRVNPECSTQEGHAIYDPCAPGSRLGTTLEAFEEELVPLLDGIHMHTLCEQNSDDLEKTVEALEDKFGKWLPQMMWLNRMHYSVVEEMGEYRTELIRQDFQKTAELVESMQDYLATRGYQKEQFEELIALLIRQDNKVSRIWFETEGKRTICTDSGIRESEAGPSKERNGGLYAEDSTYYWTLYGRQGEVALGIDIALDHLHAYFSNLLPAGKNYAYILNDSGVIVTHPEEKWLGMRLLDSLERRRVKQVVGENKRIHVTGFSQFLLLPVDKIYYPLTVGTPHLKRRLAFSTVSNLSYILFALTLMTPAGMVGGMTHMVYHAFRSAQRRRR